MALKNLPAEEKPREKAQLYGFSKLSIEELVALVLQTGNKKQDAVSLARELLVKNGGLYKISKASITDYFIPGIKKAKALKLMAIFEIAKRLETTNYSLTTHYSTVKEIASTFGKSLANLNKEKLRLIILNKNDTLQFIFDYECHSENSITFPTDLILTECLKREGKKVYFIHNHPSNNILPSESDVSNTYYLKRKLELIGIKLIDHIIVGKKGYYSILTSNFDTF